MTQNSTDALRCGKRGLGPDLRCLPPTADHNAIHPRFSLGVNSTSIKLRCARLVALNYPLPTKPPTPHSLNLFDRSYITPCYPALSPTPFLFMFHPTMVSTRPKTKTAHPAAPVMTTAAKQKAGIKTVQRRKRVTKGKTIREL